MKETKYFASTDNATWEPINASSLAGAKNAATRAYRYSSLIHLAADDGDGIRRVAYRVGDSFENSWGEIK